MIAKIKAIIDSMGIPFRYGNPSQINYYLNNVDYAAAPDGVAAYCYLLTDSEYINGKERATIAVFFSKLIPFDFNGSEAVSVTDDCKAKAKEFLHQVAIGNSLTYQDARFQYGYNDFAENVAWCAVRAVFEVTEADCYEFLAPEIIKPIIPYIYAGGLGKTPEYYSNMQVLSVYVFTLSLRIYSDAQLIINSEAVNPSDIIFFNAEILTENQFGVLPEEYQQYEGKMCYQWMVRCESQPEELQSIINGEESNIFIWP